MSDTPHALYQPGLEERFLGRLLGTSKGTTLPVLQGHESHLPEASRALSWVQARLTAALAVWALPALESGHSLEASGFPNGANPFRVQAALVELEVAGGMAELPGARAWRRDVLALKPAQGGSPSPALSVLMKLAIWTIPLAPASSDDAIARAAERQSERLWMVLNAAVLVKTHGTGALVSDTMDRAHMTEARNLLHDVLVRHVDGSPVPHPPLAQADILMLALSPDSETRSLAVTLTPTVTVRSHS